MENRLCCWTREFIKGIAKIQSQSTTNPSSISQAAAVEALNGTQDFIKNRASAFKERRDFVVKRLNSIKGLNLVKIQKVHFMFFQAVKIVLEKKIQ